MKIRMVPPRSLRPHPANARIYGQVLEINDLVDSIRQQGILEPLVALSNRTLVSGHRRRAAAIELGLEYVPVKIVAFDDPLVALVDFNRQRTKSWSARFRELNVLMPDIRAAAEQRRLAGAKVGGRMRHGQPVTHLGQKLKPRRALDEAGRMVGLSREKVRKLLRVFDAADMNLIGQDVITGLDDGAITVHEAYRRVVAAQVARDRQRARIEQTKRGTYDISDMISPFNLWAYHRSDRRFGSETSGAPAPQTWVNLIQLVTQEGDLVVDPMAGSGTVGRVAEWMQRRYLGFDLNPRGKKIVRHDLLAGFPPVPEPPKLVVLDPPYFNQRQYSTHRSDLSRSRDVEQYLERLEIVIRDSLAALATDGHVALIIGNSSKLDDSVDLSWTVGRVLERHGSVRYRIQVPYSPAHFPPYRVQQARRFKRLLSLTRELFVATPR